MSTLKERIALGFDRRPGLRPADLARACKVSTASVADWQSGKTKSMKSGPAHLASQVFGCDPTWLATGIGAPSWTDASGEISPETATKFTTSADAIRYTPGTSTTEGKATELLAHSLILTPFTVPPKLSWEDMMQLVDLPGEFALAMPDDALAPKVMRGVVLVFSTTEAPTPGRGVLVADEAGRRYVRRYAEGVAGQWLAQAVNDTYLTLESGRDGLQLLAVMTGRMDGNI